MQDSLFTINRNKQRLTQTEKDANKKQWYKDQADLLDNHSFTNSSMMAFGGVSDYSRRKVNYDLFNNIINPKEFEYVCKPFGAEVGDLPGNFTNRDITSGKIKVLLGMEMKMPFSWKIIATNEEATTRKEQMEFGKIRDFVVNEIMRPIKMQVQKQDMEQTKGKQLTPEEQDQLQQQIAQDTAAQTPDEVRKYMTREHQDPAEVMHQQLLEYLIISERMMDKFNKGFKHSNLGGTEVYHVGIFNGEPKANVVNSLFFDHDMSPDLDFIEDGEWAVAEYAMNPSEVLSKFSSELKDDEIDRIYEYNTNPSNVQAADFTFTDTASQAFTVRVKHMTWKSLMKVGFLSYVDRKGKLQMDIVDEHYKLTKTQGDVKIKWEWIPQSHECFKILNDIYVYCRPVPGQLKDLDNLYKCKLPYYGASCDSLNSPTTSPMDRMKGYQYYYDVILYRIELLMASDKGKILIANIKSIPKSAGIDTKKFMYFLEANKIGFLNPSEEGNKGGGGDITNMVKQVDMSLASDIMKYIEFAEYIEKKCGASIGVTPQMEAAIGPDEAVSNTRQNLIQASHIIQPYFELHNIVKGNVLTALLETAKAAYSVQPPKKLSYVLDDMSVKMLTTDPGMLAASTIGLFVSNSSKADEAKQAVMNLAQAAMQNQQIDLTDVIKVLRADNINDAVEDLEAGQQKKADQAAQNDKAKLQQQKDQQMLEDTQIREGWQHEEDMLVLKGKIEKDIKVTVETIAAMGYDVNKDEDEDGIPDTLEVAKFGVDAQIKARKENREDAQLQLDKDKFTHQQKMDKENLKLDTKKLNKPTAK